MTQKPESKKTEGMRSAWTMPTGFRSTITSKRHSPSVKRAFPPVGWQRTVEHEPQRTTDEACEKTVVMLKQPDVIERVVQRGNAGFQGSSLDSPGHLTSMK